MPARKRIISERARATAYQMGTRLYVGYSTYTIQLLDRYLFNMVIQLVISSVVHRPGECDLRKCNLFREHFGAFGPLYIVRHVGSQELNTNYSRIMTLIQVVPNSDYDLFPQK